MVKFEFYECDIHGMYQVAEDADIPDKMHCDWQEPLLKGEFGVICNKEAKKIRKPKKPEQHHTMWLSLVLEAFFRDIIFSRVASISHFKEVSSKITYLREYFEKERSYHQHGDQIIESLQLGVELKDLMNEFQTAGIDTTSVRIRSE